MGVASVETKAERVDPNNVITDSATLQFRQGKSILDPSLDKNQEHLDRLMKHLQSAESTDSALRFSSIKVIGAASPEGGVKINHELSRRRADRIFNYFSERTELPDSVTQFIFIGRDWNGLKYLVEKDPNVPYSADVLSLLDSIIEDVNVSGKDSEQNLLKLKQLHGGAPYSYMYRELFPELRKSKLLVSYAYLYPERMFPQMPLTPIDVTAVPNGNIGYIEDIYSGYKNCRPFYMALKTNLLYDALALPSIGAEFYLGKDWSVVGNWTYGWWDKNSTHRYWRAYGGDLAIRKWFGKAAATKPLTGHHLGIYGGVVTYDFEFGGKGYMGGKPGGTLWERCNYMAGIEYGYSLPIARRLNLDFTLGVGYMGGKVVEYVPRDEVYVWQKTKHLNWIGPTKAEISLTWLIGCDNYNRRK